MPTTRPKATYWWRSDSGRGGRRILLDCTATGGELWLASGALTG